MADFSFEMGGKKVDPNDIDDELKRTMLLLIRQHIEEEVGTLCCPDHGSAPKIVCKGQDLDSFSFEVSGCCQKLVDYVKAKLGD
jgi:hypothetical protein